ncbi:hypothetical protein JCM5353_005055 [Sporobolomyces roseus]
MPPKKGKKSSSASNQPQASRATSEPLDPIKLPFTIEEAQQRPGPCRAMVSARVWEHVELEIIKIESEDADDYVDPADSTRYLRYLDESALAGFYKAGLHVGRRFREIALYMVESHETGGDFERFWKSVLTEEVREELVIDSLDGATSMSGGVEVGSRSLAPDLSVASMNQDGGQGFVDLLRHIVQSGIDFADGSDWYPIISQDFDKSYSISRNNEGFSFPRSVRAMQTDRHNYIASFVLIVLMRCCYIPHDHISGAQLKKPRVPMDDPLKHFQAFANEPPRNSISEKYLDIFEAETQNEHAVKIERNQSYWEDKKSQTHIERCATCKRRIEEIEGLERFLYCQRCVDLKPSRRSPYCSSECQRHDFRQHRKFCGKKFEDLALPFAGWAVPPSLPPPSIGLQYQIYQSLHVDPSISPKPFYHFRATDTEPIPPYLENHNTPTSYDRNCKEMRSHPDHTKSEDLFKQAVKTRSERDIRKFVVDAHLSWKNDPAVHAVSARQLQDDWDVDSGKFMSWVWMRERELAQSEVRERVR